MSDERSTVIEAYRRIREACKKNKGVRLSADEVFCIWAFDDAVSTAVSQSDTTDQEQESEQ